MTQEHTGVIPDGRWVQEEPIWAGIENGGEGFGAVQQLLLSGFLSPPILPGLFSVLSTI